MQAQAGPIAFGRAGVIAFDEARRLILAACQPGPIEVVPTAQALGRVLAEDIASPADLPPFDNSAMDGFALACGGVSLPSGGEFAVGGAVAAGDAPLTAARGAVEIMTGAPMPPSFDGVLPIEHADVLERDGDGRPRRIRTRAEVVPGVHVRRCGQDVARGQRVLAAGARIGVVPRMLLSALGMADVRVHARIKLALLTTGRELIDDPHQPLLPGQIRNSNGPFLSDRLLEAGAELCHRETVADEPAAFLAALHRSLDAGADVVLSTGAVSMGRYDFVPDSLGDLGAELVFHKVAIRPGKPLLFARLPSGPLYFGLPGNPISSAVGLRFFVLPALRAMQARAQETPLHLPLAQALEKKTDYTLLQKALVALSDDGRLQVQLLQGQESFRIQPLLQANAWAVIRGPVATVPVGTRVEVYGLSEDGIALATDTIDA